MKPDLKATLGGVLLFLTLLLIARGIVFLLFGNDVGDRRTGVRNLVQATVLSLLVVALAACAARPTRANGADVLANPKVYSYWGNGPPGFEHWMWCEVFWCHE